MTRDLGLRATLLDVEPAVWRRLRMPAAATLADLHRALQAAFGWQDRALHEITDYTGRVHTDRSLDPDAPPEVLDASNTALAEALPARGDHLRYEYHFNDEWEVDVVRERDPHGAGVARPFLVDGARAAPPEGCGGPHDYEELLAALADPAHTEHQELRAWLPANFDPDRLDGAEIRRRLRALPPVPLEAKPSDPG
jgi:hypothetical protein